MPRPIEMHTVACMEVWGGNDAVESAISVPGIDAWLYSQPFDGAVSGGDIHYVSMCAAGLIARFALADVAGHGKHVSELAVRLRNLMRRHINTIDQSRFARSLNELFGRESTEGRFATALLATYHTPTDRLIVCNAGHPRPLWYRSQERCWRFLTPLSHDGAESTSNLPLGIIYSTEYEQYAVALGHGDLVVMYTDCLIEAAAEGNGALGEKGLLDLAATLSVANPAEFGRLLVGAVDAAADVDPHARGDDTTVLVLHHNAANPPRQTLGERVRITAKMLGLLN